METNDVIPTSEELLAELAEELAGPHIPEGAITVRMLMDKTGMTIWPCRKFLETKVAQGKMKSVSDIHGRRWYFQVSE